MIVGSRLKSLRQDAQLSTEDIGTAVGVSRQQILRYEANQTDVTSNILIKLADLFDVTADYLLGRSDEKLKTIPAKRSILSSTLDIMVLLRVFPPEKVAQTVKAAGIPIRLKGDAIDIPALLNEFPEEKVALFMAALDIPFSVKSSAHKPNEASE